MATFTYSLTKVPDGFSGKTVYRGNVQTNGTLDKDMIAKRLAVRTKQDVALWRYFLDALNDELAEEILAGYRVNLGQLSTGFAIKGSFQSEDERWDAEKHQLIPTVRTLDPLHSALKAVTLVEAVPAPVSPVSIDKVRNDRDASKEGDRMTLATGQFSVFGENLKSGDDMPTVTVEAKTADGEWTEMPMDEIVETTAAEIFVRLDGLPFSEDEYVKFRVTVENELGSASHEGSLI